MAPTNPADRPRERPRALAPFIGAVAIAVLVLAAALVTFALRSRPSADEVTAVNACEAERVRPGSYADGAGVEAGGVFTSENYAAYQAALTGLGYGGGQSPTDAQAGLATDSANGKETVWVLWRLEGGAVAQCTVILDHGVIQTLDLAAPSIR